MLSESTGVSVEAVWSPPEYDVLSTPQLGKRLGMTVDSEWPNDFPRSAKWCPDGTAFLMHTENRSFEVFHTPSEVLEQLKDTSVENPVKSTVIKQASPILEYLWYPTASLNDPSSFCFVASVRESPVKLLDASDGRLRASYPIVDHRERQIAPHSLAFNVTAQKLYCGFEDAIEVFDLGYPGAGIRLPTIPNKKSKDGLKGIISSLAFSPSYTSDVFAAGSLTPTSGIALFSESQGPIPVMHLNSGPQAGVTQLQFNPTQPHILYASYRRRTEIYAWDLRNQMGVPFQIYQRSRTHYPTNQKIKFDVDISGRHLGVGDQDGLISFFKLDTFESLGLGEMGDGGADNWIGNPVEHASVWEFKAHEDAVGSVSFHPLSPWLLSASGSRHFEDTAQSDDTSSEESDDEEPNRISRPKRMPQPIWDCKSQDTQGHQV
ncbi:WD40 repeat-like protein [Pluteus cervinus]|uniref:WD40 repeat-like protein n=1 Tax=Pluteus cervinus TaxID=181527 RepID=A0ACD3B4K9_9AGAR|nr:WD40 repeat-like protein [Pluteus cervinus]